MDIRKLQRAIVDGLEDVKGQNIVVFNTEHLSALFERVVIASGTSNRQTKALAASVRDAVKARGFGPTRTEGEENGEWIIVDCGAAVVHLMQPGIRDYYHLEEIWGEKPVRLKLNDLAPRLVKASEPEPEPGARKLPVAKKAAAKAVPKTAESKPRATPQKVASKAPAKKSGLAAARRPGSPGTPVRKAAAGPTLAGKAAATRKAPARKAAPAKKPVTRTIGVRSGRAGAAPPKVPAARNAPGPRAAKPATLAKAVTAAAKAVRRKA